MIAIVSVNFKDEVEVSSETAWWASPDWRCTDRLAHWDSASPTADRQPVPGCPLVQSTLEVAVCSVGDSQAARPWRQPWQRHVQSPAYRCMAATQWSEGSIMGSPGSVCAATHVPLRLLTKKKKRTLSFGADSRNSFCFWSCLSWFLYKDIARELLTYFCFSYLIYEGSSDFFMRTKY